MIRGFIWDISTYFFAYVLFWGPNLQDLPEPPVETRGAAVAVIGRECDACDLGLGSGPWVLLAWNYVGPQNHTMDGRLVLHVSVPSQSPASASCATAPTRNLEKP